MKTASVRELRNHYSRLIHWLEAGEEIAISKRGHIIGRLVPEKSHPDQKVDWSTSPAFRRNKNQLPLLTRKESATLLAESQGRW